MEQNVFYLQAKLIIETLLKTAADVIGTAKEKSSTGEPNVRRKVRFASPRHPVYCSFSSLFRVNRGSVEGLMHNQPELLQRC